MLILLQTITTNCISIVEANTSRSKVIIIFSSRYNREVLNQRLNTAITEMEK